MASENEGAASAGHNSKTPLTEDEAAALTTYYALKVIEGQRKADAAKVDYDAARSVVNGHFKRLKADLGFTRKEFEAEVIEKLNMTEAEYLAGEKARARLHRLAGLSQGEQIDLIDHVLADTVDDAIAAEADGYRSGRRADDPVPPAHVAAILHPDWMKGWHRGQEVNGLALAKASEILSRPKPGELAADDDEDEGDPEDDFDADAEARRLKNSGWTEPTESEAEFEAT